MSLKLEFVQLADQEEANMSALCRRFDISRPTGYKWLRRYREEGREGLTERSRRPESSPNKTPAPIAEAICEVRREHPTWGGRKIRARLRQQAADGTRSLAPEEIPAASTCQTIIKRRGLLEDDQLEDNDRRQAPFERFEKEAPNRLWQMDFKGHFPLTDGERCHTLTIVDDHSRFAIALQACGNEKRKTVKERLTAVFRRYGLPRRILMRQRAPMGRARFQAARAPAVHEAQCVALSSRHRCGARPPLPPRDSGQSRALSSQPSRRSAPARKLPVAAGMPDGLRPVALDVQLGAPP